MRINRAGILTWAAGQKIKWMAGGLALLTLAFFFLSANFPLKGLAHAGEGDVWLLSALSALLLAGFLLAVRRIDRDQPWPVLLFAALLVWVALWIRLYAFDFSSPDYESFLAPWVEKFRVYGPIKGFRQDFSDYNMPYLYILSLISRFDCSDLYLIKIVSVAFDLLLAVAAALCAGAHGGGRMTRLAAMALALLVPTVWLNSAMWGQCDSLYVSLLLLAYWAALSRKPGLSLCLAGLAFSFKLQTIFFLPVYALLWMTGRVKFRHFLLFPATYAASIVPALLFGKPLGDILGVYVQQVDQYSGYLNLNSPSAFGLLPSGVDDAFFFRVGILAAFTLVVSILVYGWIRRKVLTGAQLLTLTYLLCAGIPFFLPSMHDRYFYLADQTALLLALTLPGLWPVAPLTVAASYAAYYAYLYRQYLVPGGMALPALLMLLALCTAAFGLKCRRETPKGDWRVFLESPDKETEKQT